MVRFAASITGSLQPVGLPVIEKLSMLEAEKPTVTASPALRKTAGESNAIVPDSLSLLHEAKKRRPQPRKPTLQIFSYSSFFSYFSFKINGKDNKKSDGCKTELRTVQQNFPPESAVTAPKIPKSGINATCPSE